MLSNQAVEIDEIPRHIRDLRPRAKDPSEVNREAVRDDMSDVEVWLSCVRITMLMLVCLLGEAAVLGLNLTDGLERWSVM